MKEKSRIPAYTKAEGVHQKLTGPGLQEMLKDVTQAEIHSNSKPYEEIENSSKGNSISKYKNHIIILLICNSSYFLHYLKDKCMEQLL